MRLDHFGMYPEQAFKPIGKRMTLEGGGGKGGSAPPPPDYAGAARETAAGNKEAAIAAQEGNMVSQYTPYGSVTYHKYGTSESGTPMYNQVVTLSPEQQAAYNEDMALNARLRGVAGQGVNYVQSALNQPLSYQGLADVPTYESMGTPEQIQAQAADAAYKNATRYLDPQFARKQASLENQLANQGITRGSEAWNNAMAESSEQEQQAYENARNLAYTQGLYGSNQMFNQDLAAQQAAYQQALGARQQGISERNYLRQEPINILNAVRTGSQLQSSQMPQVGASSPGQLATWSGPDLLGATTAQGQYNQGLYNAQQAASGNLTSGLMGLGGTGMMAAAMMSDRRVKDNIIKIGSLDNGLNLYSFEYKPEWKDEAGHGKFVGVMADEAETIMPEAVIIRTDGYKMVDYGVIYG